MHKNIAYGGIAAALTVIFLMLSAYLPAGKAVFLFSASFIAYLTSSVAGVKTSVIMYAASAVLGILTARGASPAVIVLYVICFGNYPFLKKLAEGRGKVFNLLYKSVLYTVYFFAAYCVFKFFVPVDMKYSPALLFAAGAAGFAVYDVLLGRVNDYALNIMRK